MPPQVLLRTFTLLTNSSASSVLTSKSIPSISANFLNNTALPSMTGFEANAPIFPKPKTAVPLDMTATVFPFEV